MTGPDIAAVEAVNRALYAAIENADLDAMGTLWADGDAGEATVCVHPGWPPVVGRAHVLRSWALVMAGTAYIQFFLTDVRTRVVGDVAVLTCAQNILTHVGGADGNDQLAGGQVVTTNVFRRAGDSWQTLVHHASVLLTAGDEPGGPGPGPDTPAGGAR